MALASTGIGESCGAITKSSSAVEIVDLLGFAEKIGVDQLIEQNTFPHLPGAGDDNDLIPLHPGQDFLQHPARDNPLRQFNAEFF